MKKSFWIAALELETAFTVLQFAIVAPPIALAYPGAEVGQVAQSTLVAAESSRAS